MASSYYNADALSIDAAESDESPYFNNDVKLPPLGLQVPSEDEADDTKADNDKTTVAARNRARPIKKKSKKSSKRSPLIEEEDEVEGPMKATIPGLGGLSKLTEDYHHSRENGTDVSSSHQRWRDVFWGLLFFSHLAFMASLTAHYVPQMTKVMSGDFEGSDKGAASYYHPAGADDAEDAVNNAIREYRKDYYYYDGNQAAASAANNYYDNNYNNQYFYNGESYTDQYGYDEEAAAEQAAQDEQEYYENYYANQQQQAAENAEQQAYDSYNVQQQYYYNQQGQNNAHEAYEVYYSNGNNYNYNGQDYNYDVNGNNNNNDNAQQNNNNNNNNGQQNNNGNVQKYYGNVNSNYNSNNGQDNYAYYYDNRNGDAYYGDANNNKQYYYQNNGGRRRKRNLLVQSRVLGGDDDSGGGDDGAYDDDGFWCGDNDDDNDDDNSDCDETVQYSTQQEQDWANYLNNQGTPNDDDWQRGWTYKHYNKNGRYYREDVELNLGVIVSLVAFNGITGLVGSTLALGLMITHAGAMIRGGMVASVFLSLFLGLFCLTAKLIPGAIAGLVMSGFLVWYVMRVWNRIPFAAANLTTATTAVRANLGLAVCAYSTLAVAFGWVVWWTASAVATMFIVSECDGDGTCEKNFNALIFFGLLASYFWTIQVLNNIVGVTVASVTGNWWMSKPFKAASLFTDTIKGAFRRAVSYSFGSICFGSLFVAIASALRRILYPLRDSDNDLLTCIGECLLHYVANALDYFNQWAFTFVGLYGFSYTDAGFQVVEMFKSRGWETIITEDLTDWALLIVSFVVALLNGLIGLMIGSAMDMGFNVPLLLPFL